MLVSIAENLVVATVLVAYDPLMASITLKNIPEALHCTYRRRAKAHSRSLQAEILHTLAQGVSMQDEATQLAVEDVAGMLKPQTKGMTIEQMDKGIDQWLQASWK